MKPLAWLLVLCISVALWIGLWAFVNWIVNAG